MSNEEIINSIRQYKAGININENFEKINKQFSNMIYNVIYTYTTDRERHFYDVEDFYQESLIILMKCINSYNCGMGVSFCTFLNRSLKNNILNLKNKKTMRNYRNTINYEEYICDRNIEDFSEKIIEEMDNNIKEKKIMFVLNEILTDEELLIYDLKYYKNFTLKKICESLSEKYNRKYNITKIHLMLKNIEQKIENNEEINKIKSTFS